MGISWIRATFKCFLDFEFLYTVVQSESPFFATKPKAHVPGGPKFAAMREKHSFVITAIRHVVVGTAAVVVEGDSQ